MRRQTYDNRHVPSTVPSFDDTPIGRAKDALLDLSYVTDLEQESVDRDRVIAQMDSLRVSLTLTLDEETAETIESEWTQDESSARLASIIDDLREHDAALTGTWRYDDPLSTGELAVEFVIDRRDRTVQ